MTFKKSFVQEAVRKETERKNLQAKLGFAKRQLTGRWCLFLNPNVHSLFQPNCACLHSIWCGQTRCQLSSVCQQSFNVFCHSVEKHLCCSHLSISSCMTTYPFGETMSLQDIAMVQHCNVAWLYEKNAFTAQVLEAPLSWPTTWTWCSTSPLHKTNLRTAIHTSILWSLSFQGLNYRLLKVRIGALHTWLCSTCAALWIRSGPLQGVDIHSELDGIRCRLGSQVVETCLEAKLPSVEMHGRKLCSAGIHHVNVPRDRWPVTRDHWNSYIRQ